MSGVPRDTNQSDAGRLLAEWPHLYRPGTGPESGPGLLMLHGTGGNEEEISGLAADIAPGAAVLAPRGRVREHGMLRWFRRHGEGVFDVDDVTGRAGELAGFVRAAVEQVLRPGGHGITVGDLAAARDWLARL